MNMLGTGVAVNNKTAVKWLTLAAKQGYAKAQINLGVNYEFGKGVLTDTKRAYMWYNISAYNGQKSAGEYKLKIAKNMTSSQLNTAQDMSRRCLESNYTDC